MEKRSGRVQSHQPEAEAGRCSGGPWGGDSEVEFRAHSDGMLENGARNGDEWRMELAGFRATSRKLKLVVALAGRGEAIPRSNPSSL